MQDSSYLYPLLVPHLDDYDDVISGVSHPASKKVQNVLLSSQDGRFMFRPIADAPWPPSYNVEGTLLASRSSSYSFSGHRPTFVVDRRNSSWQSCSGREDTIKPRMQVSPTSTICNFSHPEYSEYCTLFQPCHGYRALSQENPKKEKLLNASNLPPPALASANKNQHFPPLPRIGHNRKDSHGSVVLQNDRSRQNAAVAPSSGENASVATTLSASSPDSTSLSFSPCAMLSQNLKNDPHRQAKIKTEMCLHYLRGTKCPFGERCNYAHGEHELKFKTLCELEKHGIIDDASTYRIHPCFSHVSTGSCPFGQRCLSIHDARVTGDECQPCWLPHLEAPVNGLPGSAYVEKHHHERLRILRQSNPLVYTHPCEGVCQQTIGIRNVNDVNFEEMEWRKTYRRVVNLSQNVVFQQKKPMPQSHIGQKHISELQRLQIALFFLDDHSSEQNYRSYIYQPTHLVYNELCMILRTKYIRLFHSSDSVKKISKERYHAHRAPWGKSSAQGTQYVDLSYCPNDVIVVQEICYGPVGRKEECRLYFDIASADIVAISPQQVKKYKKKSHSVGVLPGSSFATEGSIKNGFPAGSRPSTLPVTVKAPTFDSLVQPPFVFPQPVCDDAHALCIEIVKHRIKVVKHQLQLEKSSSSCNEWQLVVSLERELKEKFLSLQRHYESFFWPVGRDDFDPNIDIPPVRGPYKIKKANQGSENYSGTNVSEFIWNSFTKILPSGSSSEHCVSEQSNGDLMQETTTSGRPRLTVFQRLTNIEEEQSSKTFPSLGSKNGEKSLAAGEDAWKSILLYGHSNEWEVLKNHYNSSALGAAESQLTSDKNDKCGPSPSFLAHDMPLSARVLFSSSDESESD